MFVNAITEVSLGKGENPHADAAGRYGRLGMRFIFVPDLTRRFWVSSMALGAKPMPLSKELKAGCWGRRRLTADRNGCGGYLLCHFLIAFGGG